MKAPNFYASGGLDRAGHRRKDETWLIERLAHPSSRFVPVWRDQNLVLALEGAPPQAAILSRGAIAADAIEPVLLGVDEREDIAYFALDLSVHEAPAAAITGDLPIEATDLRRTGPLLPHRDAALLAYARGMAYWHARHRFCGVCGSPARSEDAGHLRRCTNPTCAAQHFPRTDPVVIMLVHDGDRCLLGRQKSWPAGWYSTLAGFVEPGESLEDAVAREVLEESGILVDDVTYHSSQPWPFPASLMLGFFARAKTRDIRIDPSELEDARWFDREALLAIGPDDPRRFPPGTAIAGRLIDEWLGR